MNATPVDATTAPEAHDKHSENAARMFNTAPSDVTPPMRRFAKIAAFSLDYDPRSATKESAQ